MPIAISFLLGSQKRVDGMDPMIDKRSLVQFKQLLETATLALSFFQSVSIEKSPRTPSRNPYILHP